MESYLEKLSDIVGPDNFSAEPAVIENLARTTLPQPGTKPLGVVRPTNREQVQEIVKLAAAQKLPLYPISTGKNWGYGDACAPMAGCLIVDLSRMNRIIEVNTELAYAIVEPGVTQGQLAMYLQDHKIPLIMDCTGAGPDTSFIGNTLDRGFGHSPYGDRFAHTCSYEAVLSDGSLMTTGFGGYPHAQVQHLYKWGLGPSLDGILSQSNVGIVTRMTVWLMPKPESMEFFFITMKSPEDIGGLVEALRRLRLQGTMRSPVHCLNDRRLLASRQRFPWNRADGTRALEQAHPELFKELLYQHGLPAWAAMGLVMGSREETAAVRRTIKRTLKNVPGLERIIFITHRKVWWMGRFEGLLQWILPHHSVVRALAGIRTSITMMGGLPVYDTLVGGHWRARNATQPTQDPLESGSGLIWLSPVLPMTAQAIHDTTKLAEPVFHEFGFEYQVTISCITERALSAVMSICFDKSNAKECSRAFACCQKLTDVLLVAGYIPYRGSPLIMERIWKQAPDYWKVLSKLKHVWDPDRIIAPGRYLP
jgi:4-cresol dehydrogenase (hydroxylating) flavoprotein subunit